MLKMLILAALVGCVGLLADQTAAAAPRSELAANDALIWPTPCPATIQCPSGYDVVTSTDGSTKLTITSTAAKTVGGTLTLHGPSVAWSSGVADAVVAIMQADGDFAAFDATGKQVWHSATSGHPGAVLQVNTSEAVILDAQNAVLWRATYAVAGQCLAATQAAEAAKLEVSLDPSDLASFATALKDPTVAQCEKTVLANATASLPTLACTIAEAMPLDPVNAPKKAVAAALQQATATAGGQFFTSCYGPYIQRLDVAACASFCSNESNLAACKFLSAAQCKTQCFGARPVGGSCPVLAKTPQQPSPFGPVH